MVYDWEGKRELCYRMYIEEKKALEEIMEYMRVCHQFAPSKRAFQTQFKRWNFPPKQNPAHRNAALVARIGQLWACNVGQREMLDTLQREGFEIKERELMRVRARHRWLLRVPNGNCGMGKGDTGMGMGATAIQTQTQTQAQAQAEAEAATAAAAVVAQGGMVSEVLPDASMDARTQVQVPTEEPQLGDAAVLALQQETYPNPTSNFNPKSGNDFSGTPPSGPSPDHHDTTTALSVFESASTSPQHSTALDPSTATSATTANDHHIPIDSVQSPAEDAADTDAGAAAAAARRQTRLRHLQTESDERWASRKRRRRTRGWAGLPADPPGPPRFPSETTIEESKRLLGLTDGDAYRRMRDEFQQVCEEMGVVKKTVAGPERWAAAKAHLVDMSEDLRKVFGGDAGSTIAFGLPSAGPRARMGASDPSSMADPKSLALALDVVCTDVTKRMRTLSRRMTIADAKNVLGLDPEQSRQLRAAFYDTLRADHFTSKLEAGDEHWRELKEKWVAGSPLLRGVLGIGSGPSFIQGQGQQGRVEYQDMTQSQGFGKGQLGQQVDGDHDLKHRALEVLCRDVMKRLRDDQTKRGPARRNSGGGRDSGGTKGNKRASTVASSVSVSARESPVGEGEIGRTMDAGVNVHDGSSHGGGTAVGIDDSVGNGISTLASQALASASMPMLAVAGQNGGASVPELQIDPSLLQAATQQQQQHQQQQHQHRHQHQQQSYPPQSQPLPQPSSQTQPQQQPQPPPRSSPVAYSSNYPYPCADVHPHTSNTNINTISGSGTAPTDSGPGSGPIDPLLDTTPMPPSAPLAHHADQGQDQQDSAPAGASSPDLPSSVVVPPIPPSSPQDVHAHTHALSR